MGDDREADLFKKNYYSGPETKNSPMFFWHNFNDFMRKKSDKKFCGVFISFKEVMKF